MIRNRYLIQVVAEGRIVHERLFTSFRSALDFCHGASSVLSSLRLRFCSVTVTDRKKDREVDFWAVEGPGTEMTSPRMAKKMMTRREKK